MIKRIFEALKEWSVALTKEQEDLLTQIMTAKTSKGFTEIRIEDVRRVQEQILKIDFNTKKNIELKQATERLKPVASSNPIFI